jgi:DNA-binding MarR family transcriptional regulator
VAEGQWLDEPEQRAWRALQRLQAELNAALSRQLLEESGLSHPDYAVLVALTDQPDGKIRPFELGTQLGWEKSRVSHHVGRMAERGLVRRQGCTTDRRGAFVVITAAGRRAIEAAAPGHVDAVRRWFIDPLTSEQLAAVADAAEAVLARLHEGEAAPSPPAG